MCTGSTHEPEKHRTGRFPRSTLACTPAIKGFLFSHLDSCLWRIVSVSAWRFAAWMGSSAEHTEPPVSNRRHPTINLATLGGSAASHRMLMDACMRQMLDIA